MPNENRHVAFVEAWMLRGAGDLPVAQRVDLFDRAFAALWRATTATLGEVTVWAIANRVVRTGRDRFPWLSSLKVEPGGISFKALREGAASPTDDAGALSFLLVDLLTVLGNLTGEILTPELHDELSQVVAQEAPEDGKGSRRDGGRKGTKKEHPHGE